jgi:hypothetical protein
MTKFVGSGLFAVVVEPVVVAVVSEVGGAFGVSAEVELPVLLIEIVGVSG